MALKKITALFAMSIMALCIIDACKKSGSGTNATTANTNPVLLAAFGNNINLNNLENYAAQTIPLYITRDNSGADKVTDAGPTLGRVLFYDKNLSISNTVACASCHKQSMAFGDSVVQSMGVNGLTTRHSMRLVNARFAQEVRFFWDKRATSLEDQTTQPIQNHNEMGYSGLNGDPDITVLIAKLKKIGYYNELFKFVYGDTSITQVRLQTALSQFVRSIQSFDSRFDAGMKIATNINQDFINFTAQENLGKSLFINPPSPPGATLVTGAGCQACHRAPEFDVDPNAHNDGVIGVAGSTTLIDVTNINPPSLRNVLNPTGKPNGLYMHNGVFNNLLDVIHHYNQITVDPANTNLDARLHNGTQGQSLRLSAIQQNAIIVFLATLSGTDVYTNKKWGNPFLSN